MRVAATSWETCTVAGTCTSADPVVAAQETADEIAGDSKLANSDKQKLLTKMLDWAEANEPDAADSIKRRLDSLGS
jgi:hypothetical protein